MVKLTNQHLLKRNNASSISLFVLALLWISFMTSCASKQPIPADTSADQPSVESSEQSTKTDQQPAVGESALSLLVKAREYAEAGKGEEAAATLERAIRIEPDNPWLWHRLAVLRMQQKEWTQAIALANRSIALANGNKRIIGGNWLVISLSEEGVGNLEAAKKAKVNSDAYLGKL